MHGDDFTISGPESELRWIADAFKNKYRKSIHGIMRPGGHDLKTMTIVPPHCRVEGRLHMLGGDDVDVFHKKWQLCSAKGVP